MKQNILKFVCGICVISGLASCDDLFEPAIENNNDISQMYVDPQFARGIMDNANLVLPYEENPANMTDVATDNAVINDINNNYKKMASTPDFWKSDNNPINEWDTRYHAIQYLNLFLENADQVQWDYSSEAVNEMHKDNYKGNAYALRGLHFYYLLRAHCGMVGGELLGVPIHLSSEDGSSDFNQPRNTFKECVDQIMSDFDEALKYLPTEYGDITNGNIAAKYRQIGATDADYNRAFGKLQRGKIDGRMIAAIKAQVALFAASPAYASAGATTYAQAAQFAATALNSVGGLSGLDPNGWRWFCDKSMIESFAYDDPDPAEICWRGVVDDRANYEEDNYPPSLKGKGRVNPTQNLVDAFPMANGYPISNANSGYDPKNPYENRDPRLKTFIVVNGDVIGANDTPINTAADNTDLDGINRESGKSTITGYYLRKLLRSDMNLSLSNHNKRHFGARIRYTEIFLDYAEAANEAEGPMAKVGGASYSAYDVIKAIRKRAGVGGDNDPYLEECAKSKDAMRELIRNERRLELCFENHRFWDLRRWKLDLNEPARGVKITTSGDGFAYEYFTVEERKYQDYMYYGPIPYSEMNKWGNLQQNDGWR
jgi:hypothetical protein